MRMSPRSLTTEAPAPTSTVALPSAMKRVSVSATATRPPESSLALSWPTTWFSASTVKLPSPVAGMVTCTCAPAPNLANVLTVTALRALPAAPLSAPPEPDWMFQRTASASAAASCATVLLPSHSLRTRLLASTSTCWALTRAPSAKVACTVLFTVCCAAAPLAPYTAAEMLLTSPLKRVVWSASSVKLLALNEWAASPLPT